MHLPAARRSWGGAMEMLGGGVVGRGAMPHWEAMPEEKSNPTERERGLGRAGGHSCVPWKGWRRSAGRVLIEVFWFK